MIHRLKSGGRLKALVEPESGQIVKIVGKSAWAGQKALVIEKQHHMSFDGMENYLTYNVLVQAHSSGSSILRLRFLKVVNMSKKKVRKKRPRKQNQKQRRLKSHPQSQHQKGGQLERK